jgi:gas vesicle protein
VGATEDHLRQEAEHQRARMGDTLDAIGDRLSPERMIERRKAAVTMKFRNVKDHVMGSPGYAEPALTRLRDRTGEVAQSTTGAVQAVADHVQHAPQAVADQARGNPLAAGIVAFGAGLLLATVLPSSRTEQRLVEDAKPQLQHAADQLKTASQEVATDAKEHARDAVEEVKSAGSDAASTVRDQAQHSAQQVKDDAQS